MNTKTDKVNGIIKSGTGFWQTDRYPIGGEFHRFGADTEVELTGKMINLGQWYDYCEFTCQFNGKNITAYARKENISLSTLRQ